MQAASKMDILPDDTLQWMWDDVGFLFATNMLWSSATNRLDTMYDLTKHADNPRPVRVSIRRAGVVLNVARFKTVAEALDALTPQAQDTPGVYTISHEARVSQSKTIKVETDAEWSNASWLSKGATVTVLEVVEVSHEHRVRANIKNPNGWISLLDTSTGHRWAEKVRHEQAKPTSEETSQEQKLAAEAPAIEEAIGPNEAPAANSSKEHKQASDVQPTGEAPKEHNISEAPPSEGAIAATEALIGEPPKGEASAQPIEHTMPASTTTTEKAPEKENIGAEAPPAEEAHAAAEPPAAERAQEEHAAHEEQGKKIAKAANFIVERKVWKEEKSPAEVSASGQAEAAVETRAPPAEALHEEKPDYCGRPTDNNWPTEAPAPREARKENGVAADAPATEEAPWATEAPAAKTPKEHKRASDAQPIGEAPTEDNITEALPSEGAIAAIEASLEQAPNRETPAQPKEHIMPAPTAIEQALEKESIGARAPPPVGDIDAAVVPPGAERPKEEHTVHEERGKEMSKAANLIVERKVRKEEKSPAEVSASGQVKAAAETQASLAEAPGEEKPDDRGQPNKKQWPIEAPAPREVCKENGVAADVPAIEKATSAAETPIVAALEEAQCEEAHPTKFANPAQVLKKHKLAAEEEAVEDVNVAAEAPASKALREQKPANDAQRNGRVTPETPPVPNEGEAKIHILPDDSIQWMWGDISGIFGHASAKLNPLRWSSAKNPMETIITLEQCNEKDARRPFDMSVVRAGSVLEEVRFETVAGAIAALRVQADAADIDPDDKVQWMWGDANALGRWSSMFSVCFPCQTITLCKNNPFCWSSFQRVSATIVELGQGNLTEHADRPVLIRTERSRDISSFVTVEKAILALRLQVAPLSALLRHALLVGAKNQEVDSALEQLDRRRSLNALIRSKQAPAAAKYAIVRNRESKHNDVFLWKNLDHKCIVAKMPNGDPVVIVGTTSDKYQVVWRGQEGWAKKYHFQATQSKMRKYKDIATFLPMLHSRQVALVRPEYFLNVAQSENMTIRQRQEVASTSFVDVSVWPAGMLNEKELKTLNEAILICVSYSWLSPAHPDPNRYHLDLLAACLSSFCKGSIRTAKPEYSFGHVGESTASRAYFQLEGWHFGGANASTVGVFFDFVSLFQKPRSPAQDRLFLHALKSMHLWYAHQRTLTWLFSATPWVLEHPYDARGWPTFERSVSELITPSHSVLNFSQSMRERILQASSPYQTGDYLQLALDALNDPLGRKRPPPVEQEVFNDIIDEKHFTNGRDNSHVKPLYAEAFKEIIEDAAELYFSNVEWEDTNVDAIMNVVGKQCKALQHMDVSINAFMNIDDWAQVLDTTCNGLNLEGNLMMAGDIRIFSNRTHLRALSLGRTSVRGSIYDFEGLVDMESLKLHNTEVAGDIKHLSALKKLRLLDLSSTNVTGDISSVRNFTGMEMLDLGGSKVTGDIASLAFSRDMREFRTSDTTGGAHQLLLDRSKVSSLVRLGLNNTTVGGDISEMGSHENMQSLELSGTKVRGNISSLGSFKNMKSLELSGTGVAGNISSLASLKSMEELNLADTSVTGDISSVKVLAGMEHLNLSKTAVTGDISSLASLTSMAELSLADTGVTGDISSIASLNSMEELSVAGTSVNTGGATRKLQEAMEATNAFFSEYATSQRQAWRGKVSNTASKRRGEECEIQIYDELDAERSWKVLFEDGHSDWFREADVESKKRAERRELKKRAERREMRRFAQQKRVALITVVADEGKDATDEDAALKEKEDVAVALIALQAEAEEKLINRISWRNAETIEEALEAAKAAGCENMMIQREAEAALYQATMADSIEEPKDALEATRNAGVEGAKISSGEVRLQLIQAVPVSCFQAAKAFFYQGASRLCGSPLFPARVLCCAPPSQSKMSKASVATRTNVDIDGGSPMDDEAASVADNSPAEAKVDEPAQAASVADNSPAEAKVDEPAQAQPFSVGDLVERRDHDSKYGWGKGYVSSIDPLKVTVSATDPEDEGLSWDEVRQISAEAASVADNSPAEAKVDEPAQVRACPRGHPLQRYIIDRGLHPFHECGGCRRNISEEEFYRCIECDFGHCQTCYDGPPAQAASVADNSPAEAKVDEPAQEDDANSYTLEQLADKRTWEKLDIVATERETYLPNKVFTELFGMSKANFAKLPKWKKQGAKKKHGLF